MSITLDFQHLEADSCELGDDRSRWIDEITQGAFFGAQIFKVDGCDFSGDYPILDFAQWLSTIAYHLNKSGAGGFYVDPYFVKKSRTEFSLEGDQVVIAEVVRKSRQTICAARVPLAEFVSSAMQYRERVFEHCFKLFPPLEEDEQIQAWLNDFPVPAPCTSP